MMLWKVADNDTWAGHCQTANGPGDRGICELRTMYVPVTLPLAAVGRIFPFLATVYVACLEELGPLSLFIVTCKFWFYCLEVC